MVPRSSAAGSANEPTRSPSPLLWCAGARNGSGQSTLEILIMNRNARCCCGSLCVETSGDPAVVVGCHCRECQRRSGSPFGVGTYFDRQQVRIEGASAVYVRDGQEGRKLRNHICPVCRTNLFWELDARPSHIG
jgi:hypothetical protein